MGQIGINYGSVLWIKQTTESEKQPGAKAIFHDGCLTKIMIPQKYKGAQLEWQHLGDLIELTVKTTDKAGSKAIIQDIIRIWAPGT